MLVDFVIDELKSNVDETKFQCKKEKSWGWDSHPRCVEISPLKKPFFGAQFVRAHEKQRSCDLKVFI